MERKWRFPDNHYMSENGLDTSDMETFKKDPLSSLAREICQNSIDAGDGGSAPVRVEFSLFEISRTAIPGIDELAAQIKCCYDYKKDSPKEGKALRSLWRAINKEKIKCLRISDFNTTGITGGIDNEKGTPFYNLTKGSGISDKVGASGGSKGIGKFASFVVSTTNTVFYSTKAIDNTEVFIGISKLRSVPVDPENDKDLMTVGMGYYGKDEKNYPIPEQLVLDPSFMREDKMFGTDVYIIGFNGRKCWEANIVHKVLDSFMVAILRGKLEVNVNGKYQIDKINTGKIIYDESFRSFLSNAEGKKIQALYELMQNDDSVTEIPVEVEGTIVGSLRVKQYDSQNEALATKQCVMIRYPYMKIKHITTGTFIPYSALCIIEDNDLNGKLRLIENPQHTDWEINRLNDFPEEKKEIRRLKKNLEEFLKNNINDLLLQSSGEETDLEGAGQFLPAKDMRGESEGTGLTSDQVTTSIFNKNIVQNPKTEKSGEKGQGYDFGKGEEDSNGELEGRRQRKMKKKPEPNPDPKSEPDDKDSEKFKRGEKPILKKIPLSGLRYNNIITDKHFGKYDCIFKSKMNENNCDFAIRLCGEGTDKYPVNIIKATINGESAQVEDGKIVGIQLEKDKIYTISYVVNSDEMFSSEVIMNAYR